MTTDDDRVKRTNTFDVVPLSDAADECLWRLLDASAAEYNEVNYARQQRYFDREDGGVWDADTGAIEGQYKDVVGSATAQQMIRKNSADWRSFFNDDEPDAGLPGFWGNQEDGRKLHTCIRNDQYTIEWDEEYSRLEIPVGSELKDEYDISGRLRLEIRGDPVWDGEHCRLEIKYDEDADTYRAFQTVKVTHDDLSAPLAATEPESASTSDDRSEEAALDIGANNLVACTTTTGHQRLYDGTAPFEQFRDTTMEIARLQSKLPPGIHSSKRIRKLYRVRTDRRNHAQNALIRHLVEDLSREGVRRVYVGDLEDVLDAHWKPVVNQKTHNFWAPGRFVDRLEEVCLEYDIDVVEASEAWTTQECPVCGERAETVRHADTVTCPCGFEGHADLQASASFLRNESEQADTRTAVRSMARPVRFAWDNHRWRSTTDAPTIIGTNPREQRTDPVPEPDKERTRTTVETDAETVQVTLGEVASGEAGEA